MARRFCWALLAVTAMTAAGRAATVRTTNFVVETARQDDAEEFARLAEHYRKQKAFEWLGKEMPPWSEPCHLRVSVTSNGAGGATTIPVAATPLRITHPAGATVQTGTLAPFGGMT